MDKRPTSRPKQSKSNTLERAMIKFRTSILALAAVAALGVTFVSSSADARGFGGGHGGGARSGGFHGGGARMGGGMRMGGFRGNMGGMRTNSFRPNRGYFGRDVLSQRKNWPGNKGTNGHCTGYGRCGTQANNWPNHRPWPRPGHWPRPGYPTYTPSYTPSYSTTYVAPTYVAPTYAAPTYAAAPSYSAPAPSYSAPSQAPASTCTCLTKSYQQDGSVLFQDTCTNEAAAAMPGQQQAQQQQPVQGGS
jgi:hypothetical protein